MKSRPDSRLDLIVIGGGLAGTAAACLATTRGLSVARVAANAGGLAFAGGPLDLLGVYPPREQMVRDDPWEGISALIEGSPRHPYAVLGVDAVRRAMGEFLAFADSAGLRYCGMAERNVTIATAVGTLKTAYRVPRSMWRGVTALQERLPTLIVDFEGMKDFSAAAMVEVLRSRWPRLQALRVTFPVRFPGIDRHNPLLAEALESSEIRAKLAEAIRPHLSGVLMVGMPAVLGIRAGDRVVADLEERLGVGIFEIPTMPPSVPGIRLQSAMEEALRKRGVQIFDGRRVLCARTEERLCAGITVGGAGEWHETMEAQGIILATGRFLGGGLTASRDGISEALFGLPVVQPPSRDRWHRGSFLDPRGHPVNEAGLAIDDRFRPLGEDGSFAFENVFAAGSILAHQDWVRTKCGAGLAVSTAHGAVEGFLRYRSGK